MASDDAELAYGGGASYDLPRWQTQIDTVSSPGQAAHSAYYAGAPPPPPPQRQPSMASQSRYLMDDQPPLSRSASLNSRGARQRPRAEDGYGEYEYGDYYGAASPNTAYSYGHQRSNSKQMGAPPPASPYSPHPPYSAYAMETTSPPPPIRSSPSTPYYTTDHPMAVDVKRRPTGLHTVRSALDLQPNVDVPVTGRRMGADGTYLSPLRQLTTNIIDTYRICNPQFRYESTHNPRRVLTKPSKPAHNEGYDNDDYDYILYVNDWLGTEDGHKYLILDILGQGTFGQVVKCQNMKTHEVVAVKVVKNKPAYFNQSMMEVTILELLNKQCDPDDEHHILRLRDSFIHRSHLCLVFELLSSNLYELIKQNQFQGLSTQLVKVFMAQLLDSLTVLKEARLIHCDLKPENILLKSLQSPTIKVIDFGSACHERQTVYTYIQSRFYRSPEVLLGMPYNASIDMWSLGCIAVELFLGLPLFPGTSEYNQLTRIVEMLGLPPVSMLNNGKQTNQFFDSTDTWNPHSNQNEKRYHLKSIEQYSREHSTNEQPGKQYFKATTLPDIINTAPMPPSKGRAHEVEKEMNNRSSFINFCQGLLDLNPLTRWSPQQARMHPFITGEKYTKPFVPDGATPPPQAPATDPKRPYGGLVQSAPKGTRAYQDAASYNQQLTQHQVYQAQAQTQAANTFRNPYMAQQASQSAHASPSQAPQPPPQQSPSYGPPQIAEPPSAAFSQPLYNSPSSGTQQRLRHQNSKGQLSSGIPPVAASGGYSSLPHLAPNAPNNSYYPNARGRANTINQMDTVPPALARLQHMNQDVIAGRNALTPVLNRDDAMKEWERRQTGKPPAAQPYPQLEYLTQQAELAASGMGNWGAGPTNHRYQQQPTSKLAHSYQPMDEDAASRRDAVMSNVRSAARGVMPGEVYNNGAGSLATPPQVYTGSSGSGAPARYQQQYSAAPPPPPAGSSDPMGGMFAPMQPDHYSPMNTSRSQPPPNASFYSPAIGGSQVGQASGRNPFGPNGEQGLPIAAKDQRRGSGMDVWPR